MNIKSLEDLDEVTVERNFNIDFYVFQYKNIDKIKEDVFDKILTISPCVSVIDKKKEIVDSNIMSQDVLDSITLFHDILTKNASKFPFVNITFVHISSGDSEQINGVGRKNASYLKN